MAGCEGQKALVLWKGGMDSGIFGKKMELGDVYKMGMGWKRRLDTGHLPSPSNFVRQSPRRLRRGGGKLWACSVRLMMLRCWAWLVDVKVGWGQTARMRKENLWRSERRWLNA